MAQTANLGLPLIDANMTADVPRDMNALANAVDTAVTEAVAGVTVPDASTTQKGVVQLNDTTTSTSKSQAATANAVKTAYDRGSAGVTAAAAAQAKADAAETPAGAQAKANAAETNAKNYTDGKAWQKKKLTEDSGVSINITGTNLNALTTTGYYAGGNLINAPSNDFYYIEVQTYISSSYVIQTARGLYNDTVQQRRYISEQGAWTAWTQDLFTSVANGKQAIATAISGKGVPATGSDEFAVLANKIGQIKTGLKFANGGLGNSYYGTISNLPFTPKALFIGVYAQKPGLTASGYAGAILQGSTIVLNGGISASSDSQSIDVKLTDLIFGSNSVSFSLTDSTAQARSYIVFGE